jgi:PAS domain S-box-containing protein
MKKNPDSPADAAELRRRAEERIQTREQTPQSAIRNPQSAQRLVHELQVHQIELELQNDELRQARAKADGLLAQYTDLYDFAPVGYLTLNEPGLIQEANLTGAKLLGVARSKLLQRPLSRFILREDADIYDRYRRRLFETRAPQSCELRIKCPDATPLWVRLDGSVTLGRGDAAPVCRVTLSDITGRKQAEADRERLAQFERLAQLMKCANDIILLTDEHGRILEVNDRALETYGYSLAELRQKTTEDLRAPADRADLPHQIEQLETDGRAVFETVHQRRDGATFPVEISARFLEIAGIRHRLGIVRNITERKRAEEALRWSEMELRAMLESIADGMLAVDDHGKVIHANRRFAELWQIPPALLETGDDRALLDFMQDHLCDPDAFLKKVQSLYHSDAADVETLAFKDGHVFERFSEPMMMDGALKGRVWSFRDITERKRAEERGQTFSQEIIAVREEERKQVSSALHHDVGSLAVGITAHLDAVEEELRSGEPGEALKWMKRTRKLFDESVARLKKLAIELRPPELDVIGLRAALRQHFAQVTERGGTRIYFRETLGRRRMSGGAATILFRVAQEALTNAITHGHATRLEVRLSASKTEVELTMYDNGKGFNLSEQLARPTSQMGLRVMREMALSAGGVFTVDSGRGKGTTVRVRLPIADRGLRNAD